jgi:alpha-mannosidase
MKFVWTEISFLDLWWKNASSKQKFQFKRLINEERIEIMTGGWVMTDEANVHYHAMLDQLIEGHQWVKFNLGISPKIGWSIDPFGQGSTVPHFLAMSDLKGAIIQRIHYNWKEFFARHQNGDFYWKSFWKSEQSSEYTLLTHNMPFDIYSTHHSCGPTPRVCDTFEFNRKIPNMDEKWLESKVKDLIGQYGRTASLFPHNVAFVLVGGDFTYNNNDEFDREFNGYEKLINYINDNSDKFDGATAQFGTPSEYFNEIENRFGGKFPALVGDFFPYADIFSTGTAAYWTGYFTTRPFYKFTSRDLEHNLRNAEILFTIAYNKALSEREKYENFVAHMEKGYKTIVEVA